MSTTVYAKVLAIEYILSLRRREMKMCICLLYKSANNNLIGYVSTIFFFLEVKVKQKTGFGTIEN